MHRVGAFHFREVNPKISDAGFRRYVQRGLEQLKKSDTPEARRTLKAITSGKVKVDLFDDLTAGDFRHMRKDLPELRKADFAKLHDGRSKGHRAIASQLNGYMWDDRVYVHGGLSAKRLASILVHEVTHVLYRSEENYRSPKAVLLEEYRSFYAERRFAGVQMTPARCRALKQYVIRTYELKGVTPEDVPDHPK